ncbi:MAG: hypothetical protein QOD48_683 [Gaiellaceae bacterium]|nr:hypothetical protein [Gaiellaceae bacterium]
MRARCKLLLALGAVLAAVVVVIPTAIATPSRNVSGAWSTGPLNATGFKPTGVNLKLPGTVDSIWTGDLAGTTVAVATFLIHPDGSVVAAPSRETFDGTLFGVRSGTLSFIEEAHGQPDGSTEIDATIIRGTGDLAQVHGRVIFLGTCDISGACAGTYTGQIQG